MEPVDKLINYSASLAVINEMLSRGIISKKDSVQLAAKSAEKSGITPCSSPHCRIRTITTK